MDENKITSGSEEIKPVRKPRKTFIEKIKGLLTAKSTGGIIVRILILLLIPYIYLLLCGLIFDKWLHLYQATTFIFISLCVLYVIAFILCVMTVKWSNEAKHGSKKKKARKSEETEAEE